MQSNQNPNQIALYGRVSGQDEGPIQTQLGALRSYAEENSLEVVRECSDQQGSRAQKIYSGSNPTPKNARSPGGP